MIKILAGDKIYPPLKICLKILWKDFKVLIRILLVLSVYI